jgi:hypothetical protein
VRRLGLSVRGCQPTLTQSPSPSTKIERDALMRKSVLLLVAAGVLSLAGSAHALTLVASSGQPVGGIWQRWVNEARTATWSGSVILDTARTDLRAHCGTDVVGGCFSNADPAEIWLSPRDGGRYGLFHEMGHMFDYEVLTDVERTEFMRIWRVPAETGVALDDQWWQGEQQADPMSHGPLGEWFAEGYRLCATYGRWTWARALSADGDQYGYPAQRAWGVNGRSSKWAWTIQAQQQTCRLIDTAAS